MEHGSFPALIGQDRFKGSILDLLRGLLQDDLSQRWTLSEVEEWLAGERLSPKRGQKRIKANRPIIFNGKKYVRPELLAYALKENPAECAHMIDSGELDNWLQRAIDNEDLKKRVEKALLIVQEGEPGLLIIWPRVFPLPCILTRPCATRACAFSLKGLEKRSPRLTF